MKSHPIARVLSVLLPIGVLAGGADAAVLIQAEVLSSDSTSSTVRFTFSGDLADLQPQINLQNFLFIDFASSTSLGNSLPGAQNFESFNANTVETGNEGVITTVEVRNNEGYYFDRISFVFDLSFASGDSLSANSVLEVVLPTSSPISTSDFNNLDVYWSFPDWGTNEGRGTLAGTVNPVATPASISISSDATGQVSVEFTGVLQSSPDLLTPFEDVPGATSPYLVPAGSPPSLFFRASDE